MPTLPEQWCAAGTESWALMGSVLASAVRRGRVAGAMAIGLTVMGGSVVAEAAPPVTAATAKAATSTTLYVKPCTATTGNGSWASPFCTLKAAQAAVQPGQTVLVEPGDYKESLVITRSGTASAPITFAADNHASSDSDLDGRVYLDRNVDRATTPVISVSGAHDVVVRGFAGFTDDVDGIDVASSSDVTIDQDFVSTYLGKDGVQVSGSSSDVTISRNLLSLVSGSTTGAGVVADSGVSGLVVTGNEINSPRGGISVTGSSGAEITGNTVVTCGAGIALGAGSTSSVVENNIETPFTAALVSDQGACPSVSGPGISVATGATTGTTVDYNVVNPATGVPLYSWAGTGYATAAGFRTASGQGAHDLAADPQLTAGRQEQYLQWFTPSGSSPALDSANPAAPGEPASDLFGDGRADDPDVANTGTGIGYADRGAVENLGAVALGSQSLSRASTGALDGVAADVVQPSWKHTGDLATVDYTFLDEADPDVVTRSTSLEHTFHRAGHHCVKIELSLHDFFDDEGEYASPCQVFGADYTPLTPTRLLNTRNATGVSTTTPLAAGATLTLPLPTVNAIPAAQVSAVVLSVTDTGPTAAGGLDVYGAGTADQGYAAVDYAAGATRSNLVTVPMTTGITVHNTSKGTVHVILDLEGYYSATGSGYEPLTPVRKLNTTTGLGAGGVKAPVAAKGSLTLTLSPTAPTTATAAVLTVTASAPTAAGGLTIYPAGTTRPVPYDVDFAAKSTVTTQVVARVAGGKVTLYNGSAGTVQLAVHLEGFYGPAASGATDSFVPYGPFREHDSGPTQVAAKGTIGPDLDYYVDNATNRCYPGCPAPAAFATTVTAVAPKAAGSLIIYPYGTTRSTIPTVSYGSGQTVADAATPLASSIQLKIYVNSTGSARIYLDESGYFIPAV